MQGIAYKLKSIFISHLTGRYVMYITTHSKYHIYIVTPRLKCTSLRRYHSTASHHICHRVEIKILVRSFYWKLIHKNLNILIVVFVIVTYILKIRFCALFLVYEYYIAIFCMQGILMGLSLLFCNGIFIYLLLYTLQLSV